MNARRKGTTLIELLVALPLAAVIGALAVALLLDTHKLARRLHAATAIGRELRQASAVLAAEIRPMAAPDLLAWSDTSIELHKQAASGIVCATSSSNTIDMLPLNGSDPLRTVWLATPEPGNEVLTLTADSALMPVPRRWQSSLLQGITRPATSPCTGRSLLPNSMNGTERVVRLTLAAFIDRPPLGSPVRITQRARYSLYKASDGLWYLGLKTLSGGAWTIVQPVAGPLNAPQQRGLVLQVRDSANNIMPFGDPRTPRSVSIVLQRSSLWLKSPLEPGVKDSVLLHVTLRGQMLAATP